MIRDYETDVNSDTDTELEYKAGEDAARAWKCQSAPADIPPGLIQNPTDRTRRYEMVDNSDTDSAAELEYKDGEDACAWKCQNASANIPPGLVQNTPTDIMRTYMENDEYPEKLGRGGCVDSSLHPPWICSGQQHCWGGR